MLLGFVILEGSDDFLQRQTVSLLAKGAFAPHLPYFSSPQTTAPHLIWLWSLHSIVDSAALSQEKANSAVRFYH